MSQWRVDLESTTTVMASLHQNLQRSQAPGVALRGAMLLLMKDPRYSHPFYRAAFVAAGN